jgi:hypothetical protein
MSETNLEAKEGLEPINGPLQEDNFPVKLFRHYLILQLCKNCAAAFVITVLTTNP